MYQIVVINSESDDIDALIWYCVLSVIHRLYTAYLSYLLYQENI